MAENGHEEPDAETAGADTGQMDSGGMAKGDDVANPGPAHRNSHWKSLDMSLTMGPPYLTVRSRTSSDGTVGCTWKLFR